MINPKQKARKQLSEFEKSQIMAYTGGRQSVGDIVKKLNGYHSSIDVFLKKW